MPHDAHFGKKVAGGGGGLGGGGEGGGGEGEGGGGDGDGGGGDGERGDIRGPQSMKSVPRVQPPYPIPIQKLSPGPPSSQEASEA